MSVLRSTIALASERTDAHSSHRLTVETQASLTGRDENISQAVGVGCLDLKDPRIVRAGGEIGALDQIDALGEPGFMGRGEHGIKIVLARFLEARLNDGRGTLRDVRCDARRFANFLGTQIVAVGVAGTLTRNDPYADAEAYALGRALDDPLIDTDRRGGQIFEIKVGIFAARGESLAQVRLKVTLCDAESLGEEGLGKPHTSRVSLKPRGSTP